MPTDEKTSSMNPNQEALRDAASLQAMKKKEKLDLIHKLISLETPDEEKINYFKNEDLFKAENWLLILRRVSLDCLKSAFSNKALCDLLTPMQFLFIIKEDETKQKIALEYPHIFDRFTKGDDKKFLIELKSRIVAESAPYKNLPADEKRNLFLRLQTNATTHRLSFGKK